MGVFFALASAVVHASRRLLRRHPVPPETTCRPVTLLGGLPLALPLALPRERVSGRQALGLTGAAVATVLPALGRGHPHVAE